MQTTRQETTDERFGSRLLRRLLQTGFRLLKRDNRRDRRALVRDAILRTLQAADIAGIRALFVQALDENSAAFYRHLGFAGSAIDPLTLMLPLPMADRALES